MADLITPEEARAQTRGEPEDAAMLALYARAAERMAMQFLNRKVFATAEELNAALAAAANTAPQIEATYEAEVAAAEALADVAARDHALRAADLKAAAARVDVEETLRGIVITDDIKIGMLLVLGHLYRNRESTSTEKVSVIEMGAHTFLWPYRVGLGV